MIGLWVCLMYAAGQVMGASQVPFITPCHAKDFSCMKTSAQKAVPVMAAGVKDIGVKPMDPMHIDKVKADQAGLKLEFRKTTVKGLRNCVVMSIKQRNVTQTLEIKCSLVLVGEYTIGGKLLILPVEGDGKYKIKIRDLLVRVTYDLISRTADSKKYWSLINWSLTSELKTGAEFQFQNLFNGNKQLSDSVHEFANSNSKEIFAEVAPPIVKAIVARIVDEVKKLFDKVPVSDLILN
ncbi:hypothetical protein NE865_13958 [Phthorimaea operculella]|nr:hypothetical protein NE865_13958 [Phthorimaea operculella]